MNIRRQTDKLTIDDQGKTHRIFPLEIATKIVDYAISNPKNVSLTKCGRQVWIVAAVHAHPLLTHLLEYKDTYYVHVAHSGDGYPEWIESATYTGEVLEEEEE